MTRTFDSSIARLAGLLLAAGLAVTAAADVLVTKGGSKYEGKVTKKGSTYTVEKYEGGTLTLPASMVREVIAKAAPEGGAEGAGEAEKPDPRAAAAIRSLNAEVAAARKAIREAAAAARARHAKAGASARSAGAKELAAYAELDRAFLAETRTAIAAAREALAAAEGEAGIDRARSAASGRIAEAAAGLAGKLEAIAEEHAAASTASADWPGWRGPGRDGKSSDSGLLKAWPAGGPQRLWHATGVGKGFATVAVTGGMVYTAGDVGGRMTVLAFDLSGQPKWQTPVDQAWTKNHPGARSTPVVADGRLYVVSGHGTVACMDAATGKPIWSRRMREFGGRVPGWGYSESPLVLGNLVVVTPGGRNAIVALDARTGKPVWASEGVEAGAQYASNLAVRFGGTTMIVAGTHAGIVAVDARTGKGLWANGFSAGNTANCPTPAYADGHVFWANGYGKGGICLKLTGAGGRVSAERAWTTGNMVCHHGGYVIHEGHIYGNHGGGWACLELTTGNVRWQQRGVGKGSLCWADGMLYLFGERGGQIGLATCSPEGMETKGTFSVAGDGPSWAHPVVTGGRLYLRYADNLYCYNVKAE